MKLFKVTWTSYNRGSDGELSDCEHIEFFKNKEDAENFEKKLKQALFLLKISDVFENIYTTEVVVK